MKKKDIQPVYGAQIFFNKGDKINVGDRILEWDPFAMPVISEVAGKVTFEDLVVGSTVSEQMDPVTGLTQRVVIEARNRRCF